jgi:hypothetical protein
MWGCLSLAHRVYRIEKFPVAKSDLALEANFGAVVELATCIYQHLHVHASGRKQLPLILPEIREQAEERVFPK